MVLKNLIVSADSIKGPVINSKEQGNNNNNSNLSILELTSLDDDNSSVCPVLHLKSLLFAASFKSHSTRSAMASLLLSNNIRFHVVKKMGRWKSNDTVDTFHDKKIIGEKSCGFLNTVVKL
ncbi:hypothetical protein ACTA71_004095 [Dictyostelium dimigraforme]